MAAQLQVTFKPAYYALLECAEMIAEEQGTDFAVRWAERELVANYDLFCKVECRPALRLIQGGGGAL